MTLPGDTVDWEVELVAVIGRRADRAAEADGWAHVAGNPDGVYRGWFARHYTVAALHRPDFHIDGTARDSAAATDLLVSLRTDLRVGVAADKASGDAGRQTTGCR